MIKKLFVVSDVHGHYTEMIKALEEAGFDTKKEDHVFVSCGDLFDRGKENKAVYDFVRGLKNKILIKGNHEDILYNVLDCGYVTDTDVANGTDITVAQLLGEDAIDSERRLNSEKYGEKIRELASFIENMSDYYETEEYVFTHGWLPIIIYGRTPKVDFGWRYAKKDAWTEARLLEWQQLYSVGAVLPEKTMVVGHRPAELGRMFDPFREPDLSEPFYGEGMIAIDAYTVRSGRVNVFVAEQDQ